MSKTTRYPEKSIEQQMRERAFKVKKPVDWMGVALNILIGALFVLGCILLYTSYQLLNH